MLNMNKISYKNVKMILKFSLDRVLRRKFTLLFQCALFKEYTLININDLIKNYSNPIN